MVIAHNMLAMYAQNQFNKVDNSKKKSTEKLSSGFKINRASDDAAGLTISEKMRSLIKGLNQGALNCQDGVSFNQIADGAMNEVNNMLHRMTELSVKSANGTNTEADRDAIQREINALVTEIDRISTTTEFNTLPVFGWDMKKLSYAMGADGNPYVTGTDTYSVVGINHGLANVVGLDHIYSDISKGKKTVVLDSQLDFSTSGWHSTGEVLYSNQTSYSEVIDKICLYSDSKFSKSDIESAITSAASSGTSVTLSYGDRYLTINALDDGVKDLDNNSLISRIQYDYGEKDSLGADVTIKKGTYNLSQTIGSIGYNNGDTYGSAWIDFSGLGTDYTLEDLVGEGFNSTCATCSRHYSIYFTDDLGGISSKYSGSYNSPRVDVNINGCTTGSDVVKAIMDAVKDNTELSDHFTQYAYNDSEPSKIYIYDNRNSCKGGGTSKFEPVARSAENVFMTKDSTIHDPATGDLKTKFVEGDGLWIQSGSHKDNGFYIKRARIDSDYLGIDGLDVSTQEAARNAIELLNNANDLVSRQRSMVGAQQNKCECAVSVNKNTAENTEAAESRIRDTDMASEMVMFSKDNILLQVGQSMLSQANQSNQSVLNLLQ